MNDLYMHSSLGVVKAYSQNFYSVRVTKMLFCHILSFKDFSLTFFTTGIICWLVYSRLTCYTPYYEKMDFCWFLESYYLRARSWSHSSHQCIGIWEVSFESSCRYFYTTWAQYLAYILNGINVTNVQNEYTIRRLKAQHTIRYVLHSDSLSRTETYMRGCLYILRCKWISNFTWYDLRMVSNSTISMKLSHL